MIILHIPDVVGNNSVSSLASLFQAAGVALPYGNKVKWIRIAEVTSGTTNSRLGGANVSATNGMPLDASDSGFLPPLRGYGDDALYDLDLIFVYRANGDTLAIAVGVWEF